MPVLAVFSRAWFILDGIGIQTLPEYHIFDRSCGCLPPAIGKKCCTTYYYDYMIMRSYLHAIFTWRVVGLAIAPVRRNLWWYFPTRFSPDEVPFVEQIRGAYPVARCWHCRGDLKHHFGVMIISSNVQLFNSSRLPLANRLRSKTPLIHCRTRDTSSGRLRRWHRMCCTRWSIWLLWWASFNLIVTLPSTSVRSQAKID